MSTESLNVLQDVLKASEQKLVLNGKSFSWASVNAGVYDGSILGPLLFLIYINDLPEGLSSNLKLFSDDTSLLYTKTFLYKNFYIMILKWLANVQTSGKWAFTSIYRNKLRKSFLTEKAKTFITLH